MGSSDGLITRAVAGDYDAVTQLLTQYGPEVERSLSIGREWRAVLEPSDVMQVTYLEAFLEIEGYDPTRSEPFSSWLRRIAENNLRDAIRALQRQKRPQPQNRVQFDGDPSTRLLETLGAGNNTPSRQLNRNEREARLDVALASIPEDYAQAVRFYDLQALPIAEVARRLSRSPGAVHMLRARAYDRLREILGTTSFWFSTST